MPGIAAVAAPALIGLLGSLFGGGGGGSSGGGSGRNPLLDERAGLENTALRDLLSQLQGLRGDAGAIRDDEQAARDAIGVLFNLGGFPGLTDEESAFFEADAARFEGIPSVAPAQNEFARLSSLLAPLVAGSQGNAANVLAGLDDRRGSEVAGAFGNAAGGISQFFTLQNLLASLQGGGETILNNPAQPFDPFGVGVIGGGG